MMCQTDHGQRSELTCSLLMTSNIWLQLTITTDLKFATDWNTEHAKSSPILAKSKGKAEQAFKTEKALIRKAKSEKHYPFLALLDFKNTPTHGMDSSPRQRLMSHRTKTLLSTSGHLL